MNFSVRPALDRVAACLLPALDIVTERVDTTEVPSWCKARGWSQFLLGLSNAELERCEASGLAECAPTLRDVPPSLLSLAEQVRELSALPVLANEARLAATESQKLQRGVSFRKQQQLSALLDALTYLAPAARRIVDVGAGSGHFTRLSAAHFNCDVLGVERNPERVARAQARSDAAGDGTPSRARFAVVDAGRERLELAPGDLAIGLHACGELGDTLVRVAAESGADLALISCCLQKISSEQRLPLSHASSQLALPKTSLGLSNLTSQAIGVESSIERTMSAREARYALRALLLARGQAVSPGSEMHGINRRRALSGLAAIAEQALADRGLPSASADEIRAHAASARVEFGVVRRLSLPRNMLARAVELSVIYDRAAHLEENGYAVRVATLFESAVTPRNIALFASREPARLPDVQSRSC